MTKEEVQRIVDQQHLPPVIFTGKLGTPEALSLEDIRTNTKEIKRLLQGVMRKGVDYGTTPGCGPKPALFKAGSEKIMMMFRLGAFPKHTWTHPEHDPEAIEIVVETKLVHQPTGTELGVGLGSASSNEEKYKWKSCSEKEWEATPEERRRIKHYMKRNGKKEPQEVKVHQVRTNPADVNNTLLKMAYKRSKIDAVLTCTAASDIFTQDLVDEKDDEGQPIIQQEEPLKKPEAKGAPKEQPTAGPQDSQPCPTPSGFKQMKSQYDGTCKGCSKPFTAGAEIFYSKEKGTYHKSATCTAALP